MLKIDTRESRLIELVQKCIVENEPFSKIQVVVEVLLIGDIMIGDDIIVERKTLTDLSASIKDGRYEEQSYRLSNTTDVHNHNIIYLIEGNLKTYKMKADINTLYSAMFSINYYKGFSLHRSFDIAESAFLLCNMAYKLEKSKKSPFYSKVKVNLQTDIEAEDLDKNYCKFVKKNKKENITPENINEIMLQQIPGIQSITSTAILSHFQTVSNLTDKIKENPNCLNHITLTHATTGKVRKLSKSVIASLIKYLHK